MLLKIFYLVISLFLSTYSFSQTDYKLCDDQKKYPYYNPVLKYKGGFWAIKNHYKSHIFDNEFDTLKNNSGIITIQFTVNCHGIPGNYVTKTCDLGYQKYEINQIILNKILNLTKELQNWIPAKNEVNNYVNSHIFFSFRFENGILIEILPK